MQKVNIRTLINAIREEHRPVSLKQIDAVDGLLFKGPYLLPDQIDIIIILGSSNCGYRALAGCRLYHTHPAPVLLTGGNLIDGRIFEADHMKAIFLRQGIDRKIIYTDRLAKNTRDNMVHSMEIMDRQFGVGNPVNAVVITAGFHVLRTAAIIKDLNPQPQHRNFSFYPAFGEHTAPDTWYKSSLGRKIIAREIEKVYLAGTGEEEHVG